MDMKRTDPTGWTTVDPTTGQHDIVLVRPLPVPAREAWSALTDRDRLAAWFGRYEGVAEVGSTVQLAMSAEEGATAQETRILACDAPRHLAVARGEWRFDVTIEADPLAGLRAGGNAEGSDDGASSTLRFVHHLSAGESPALFGPGWEYYLDRYESVLGLRQMPDWEGYEALSTAYEPQNPSEEGVAMSKDSTHETRVDADPDVPVIRIVREFDAPIERVYRAWVDPELVARWLGPADTQMRIDRWDIRTGGAYEYTAMRDDQEIASFYGSFHEVREPSRIVQTSTFTGVPDGVTLETARFEDLGAGRTRTVVTSVLDSFEARDAILASGMAAGVVEGYTKMDHLLRNEA